MANLDARIDVEPDKTDQRARSESAEHDVMWRGRIRTKATRELGRGLCCLLVGARRESLRMLGEATQAQCSIGDEVFDAKRANRDGGIHATNALPLRTKGGLTTRAARRLSRTSTSTTSPGRTAIGRRASAIDLPSVGLNDPLVISPSP